MTALLIGYARCPTDEQDLTVQREGLAALGVPPDRTYVDHGLTGCNRERPGLREALAACREGDTLVVTKLDRLARSLPDARAIADELTARPVRLSLGGAVYDPTDPVGRSLFNMLAMVAEFEADLIRLRTSQGMRVAKTKGRLRGKQPKLSPRQEAHLVVALMKSGEYSTAEIGDLFSVARSTVYRAIGREAARQRAQRSGDGPDPLNKRYPVAVSRYDQPDAGCNALPVAGRCPAWSPLMRDIASFGCRLSAYLRSGFPSGKAGNAVCTSVGCGGCDRARQRKGTNTCGDSHKGTAVGGQCQGKGDPLSDEIGS